MKKDNKPPSGAEREFDEEEEIPDQDFQFVLKQLLSVIQPLLEEELERAKSPERLSSEASKNPITCEEEFEFANRLFEKFFQRRVAVPAVAPEARAAWVQSPTGLVLDTCAEKFFEEAIGKLKFLFACDWIFRRFATATVLGFSAFQFFL